jgi:hypothetical protein
VSVELGTVTRLDGDGRPYAEIPALAAGREFGPLLLAGGVEVEPGTRVVVAFVGRARARTERGIVTAVLGGEPGPVEPPPEPPPPLATVVLTSDTPQGVWYTSTMDDWVGQAVVYDTFELTGEFSMVAGGFAWSWGDPEDIPSDDPAQVLARVEVAATWQAGSTGRRRLLLQGPGGVDRNPTGTDIVFDDLLDAADPRFDGQNQSVVTLLSFPARYGIWSLRAMQFNDLGPLDLLGVSVRMTEVRLLR